MQKSMLLALGLSAIIGGHGIAQCKNGCTSTVKVALQEKNIVETAQAAGSFKTLVAAAIAAGLDGVLSGPGPFTVFAPNDAAFAKLPEGTVGTLLKPENKARLAAILKYHVVSGRVLAKDVVKLTGATTLLGQRAPVSVSDAGVSVAGAKVLTTDILCSNGVIHVIDSVILPAELNLVEVAVGAKSFSTLLAAAKAAGLASVLADGGPFTLFAPTDEAFAKLPEGTVDSLLKPENKDRLVAILKHHLVKGRVYASDAIGAESAMSLNGGSLVFAVTDAGVTVSGARVLSADIDASNGVIHVIDSVLLP